ncbi:MAG TPA: hypothetical protein VHM25_21310, partial [Polyangiaceae bacterium]|nr:hypothetical protein [Polyangiaceae bacterium]
MAQTDETITIEIPMSPPRRLLAPGRWRSFKTNPDRQVWQDAIGRACEPWRCVGTKVVRVEIDWGKSKP